MPKLNKEFEKTLLKMREELSEVSSQITKLSREVASIKSEMAGSKRKMIVNLEKAMQDAEDLIRDPTVTEGSKVHLRERLGQYTEQHQALQQERYHPKSDMAQMHTRLGCAATKITSLEKHKEVLRQSIKAVESRIEGDDSKRHFSNMKGAFARLLSLSDSSSRSDSEDNATAPKPSAKR